MSDKIKPSEVSEVLLKELQSINSGEQFDEVGTVLTVADGVARYDGHRDELGGRQHWLCTSGANGWH